MCVVKLTSALSRPRLWAVLLMIGTLGALASCVGSDTATPEVIGSPSRSASPAQTALGGPVKVIVIGIRGPRDVRGNELGVVLFRAHPPELPLLRWEGLGGSNVIVADDGSVPDQYLRQPDPQWRQSKGRFPYFLPEVLTVPPGDYELRFWLSAGKLVPDIGGHWDHKTPRWFPAIWGAGPDPENTIILGTCHTAFTVSDELGATVRVSVPEFTPATGLDFSMTCPAQ